jgi:type I restriction enzyme S subunit
MAGEWESVLVSEVADSISDTHLRGEDKLVFLNTSDVLLGKVLHRTYSEVGHWPGQAKKSIRRDDILFSEIRPANGRWAFIDFDAADFVVSTKLMVIRPRTKRVVPRFLYHFLTSAGTTGWLQHLAESRSGTFPQITFDQVAELELGLPSLDAQEAVAKFLDCIDDKIELNRRTNETLEAMARALFKSWFVDFDPVRAKVEGRATGLPQPLADLFPDSFENSGREETPRAWALGRVDDEFDLTMGQSPPGNTYNDAGDGLPFYQGRTDFGSRFPTRRVFCTAPTRRAKQGDTLISVRAPVGDINMAAEDCAIGRGVASARHKTGSRSYTYQFMRSQSEVFDRFEGEGTVFGSIGKKDFHAISCVVPPRSLVVEFERRLAPVDGRIEITERETRTLACLRDALLPKLISGELRLKQAEKIVERVV